MEEIIENLLLSDTEAIKKATSQLNESYKDPSTVPKLCQLVVSSKNLQVRQFSAVLLRRHLAKRSNWNLVLPEHQAFIKNTMLNALVQEQEKSVRTAIAQFVGILIRHESDKKDPWMTEVLNLIFQNCASSDQKQSELGASVFAQLTDTAPDQFVPHIEAICGMFTAALISTEASGNMANPVIYNILLGMGYLVPFILGHNNAEHTYQKSIPLVIKSLNAFAFQNVDFFVKAFEILEGLADFAPKLLTLNIQDLLLFSLELAGNNQIDSAIRVKTVAYIGTLVRLKKKIIVKQKLIEPILQVIFNLIASDAENEDDGDNEEYFLGSDSSSPMTTATQTMDLLALHVPPEKLIPPLLQLLEPSLRGDDPSHKKAAYLCIAVIAEGCSEAICAKYLKNLLEIVKIGIVDLNPIVRNAAFFALGQFSEHLQPDITKYAPEILPILFQFLHQLCVELKAGGTEPKHIDRMFYALETFCENLDESEIVPHLPNLMERLFEALNPNNSLHLRELALSAVSSAANAAKQNMLPYFPSLIEGLKMYLLEPETSEIAEIQPQAIDTLAALARTIGKETFLPLANDTMNCALKLLENAEDPDLRRAIYNLIASIAEVVNEDMASVYPKIMEKLYKSILSTEEVVPEFKENTIQLPSTNGHGDGDYDENEEIDIEDSDDEDDDIAGYSVENSYLDEKEEAILALKEFAEHTGAAFIPYLQESYQNVYKMIDHPQEDIRKVSIDTLCKFVIALFNHNDHQGVTNAILILVPKLGSIISDDEECTVVMAALDGLGELLKKLKCLAIPNEDICNVVFTCIHDVMNGKVACQFDDPANDDEAEESEYDEAVHESAGNILPLFGHALQPDQFAMFFGRILPMLLHKIEKSNGKEELNSQRSFAFGTLCECYAPLQNYSGTYFQDLLPIMLSGLNDGCDQVRQNCVFGIGEMVLYAEEKSYESFSQILNALSQVVSVEKHQGVLDNIVGAIARLILTNSNLIPLDQVLPVFIKNLPLKEDFDENLSVFKSIKVLYIQGKDIILQYLEQILAIGIHVLFKKEFKDQETYENIVSFTREIREKFPEKITAVIAGNQEISNFVQML